MPAESLPSLTAMIFVLITGVWMPTKMQVKNVDGKIAGETFYSGLKVNQNLSDTLFSTK